MKQYFFVTTFGSIHDRVLPLMETVKQEKVVVIATTQQIYNFFDECTDFETILLDVNPDLINNKQWYKIFSNLIKCRKEYNRLFKDVYWQTVYFFGSGWAIAVYYMIERLAKNNKVIQHPSLQTTETEVLNGFKPFIMNLFTKLFLGITTVITKEKESNCTSYDFVPSMNIDIMPYKEWNKKPLQKYMKNIESIKGKEIIYLTEDLVKLRNVSVIRAIDINVKLDNLIDDSKFVVKPHPRLNKVYGSRTWSTIPSYIPAELLMHHPWKYAIGTESFSLINMSLYTNAKVISIIDLYDYEDKKVQKGMKKWIKEQSKGKVLFPQTWKELEKMI